jgi:hypothetical protein
MIVLSRAALILIATWCLFAGVTLGVLALWVLR